LDFAAFEIYKKYRHTDTTKLKGMDRIRFDMSKDSVKMFKALESTFNLETDTRYSKQNFKEALFDDDDIADLK